MEVAEQANGVQKSSTSISENSSEVSVEKTASGTIESAKTQQKSVEQSVQQSVQKTEQSTRVVQQSVTSSSSDESSEKKPKKVVKKEKSVDKKEKTVAKEATARPAEETKKVSSKTEEVVETKVVEVIEQPKQMEATVAEAVEEKKIEKVIEEVEEEEEEDEVEEVEEVEEEEKVVIKQQEVTIEDVNDDDDEDTTSATIVLKKKEVIVEEEPKKKTEAKPVVKEAKPVVKEAKPVVKEESEASSESEEEEVDEEPIKSKKVPSESPAESADDESEESESEIDTKPSTQTIVTRETSQNNQNQKSSDGTQQLKEALSLQQSEQTTNEASNRVGDDSTNGKGGGAIEIKQENIKNTLKEIISDIDRVIEQEEKVQRTEKPAEQQKPSQQQDATPGIPKQIDLQKILTPAEDAEEIVPQKNRKLYASSAFFTPGLHPTVEDQVELARRISSSLCDSSNQQSKGQSMYVNRMKRSVKWVHEGEGQADNQQYNGYGGDNTKETHAFQQRDKLPLKLVMDPRGQVQDLTTLQNCGVSIDNSGMLSPDRCAELVTALYAPQGKGAELFAKRRKRSEKWIVDETTAATRSPSGVPYSPIPAYTDAGVQRVQQNMKLDQIQAKYAEPRVKLVKSPWEAVLETGSATNAFQESQAYQQERSYAAPAPQEPDSYAVPPYQQYSQPPRSVQPKSSSNSLRDLAYKPSIPQGWNAPPPNLPSDSPSFEDQIIQNIYSTLDHTVENASCFVQSLSNYNSLNHALSLYVDSHSDHLSNSTYNNDYLAQNHQFQVDQFVSTQTEHVNNIDDSMSLKTNEGDYYSSKEVVREETRISKNTSKAEFENFQLKHVQHKEVKQNGEVPSKRLTNGVKITEDFSNKENEENFENDENYTKIPVKDLISTFEKQTRPVIRYKLREDKLPEPARMTVGVNVHETQPKEIISKFNEETKQSLQETKQFEETNCHTYSNSVLEFNNGNAAIVNDEIHLNGNTENENIDSQTQQDVYTPPEIPLHVYGAPPTNNYLPAVQPQYDASRYQAPPPSSLYSQYQQSAAAPPPSSVYKPNPIAYSPPNQGINQSPTPYNPSPISTDKLAIFEQNQQYQSTQHQSRQQTRRPLTVPNTIVRNISPQPYGSSGSPVSKPINYGQQQKYPSQPPHQGQPLTLYNNTSKNVYESTEDNYSYKSSSFNSTRTPINLDQAENYNRAARGWGQSRDYYRPITFSKPKIALPYSDF